jgi:hypothetical protein
MQYISIGDINWVELYTVLLLQNSVHLAVGRDKFEFEPHLVYLVLPSNLGSLHTMPEALFYYSQSQLLKLIRWYFETPVQL